MDIEYIFHNFSQMKVLVIGDLMVDRYLLGKVTRVSPEAPVPIVEWQAEENRLGGAGNVALNVQALGATVHLCGIVGQDLDSEVFFDLMLQNELDPSLIIQLKNRPTTTKTRIIANDQHLLRLDKEVKEDLNEKEAFSLINRVEINLLNK